MHPSWVGKKMGFQKTIPFDLPNPPSGYEERDTQNLFSDACLRGAPSSVGKNISRKRPDTINVF